MRRWAYWAGVLGASWLLVAGVLVAVRGYLDTGSPADVVRDYFDALARSDAPAALALGAVPAGPHTLLTSTVLREQQGIAPLRGLRVLKQTDGSGTAVVSVSYTLDFPGHPQAVQAKLGLSKQGHNWRLDRVAVPTMLTLSRAEQRASIVGTRVPTGPTMLFPGAVPVSFDTPYLQLDPADNVVSFDTAPPVNVIVEASDAGRRAAQAATATALRACLSGRGSVACPLPDGRYVPDSLRGTFRAAALAESLSVAVTQSPAGQLFVSGSVPVAASYRRLDFTNRVVRGHGRVNVQIDARTYAVAPLAIAWTGP